MEKGWFLCPKLAKWRPGTESEFFSKIRLFHISYLMSAYLLAKFQKNLMSGWRGTVISFRTLSAEAGGQTRFPTRKKSITNRQMDGHTKIIQFDLLTPVTAKQEFLVTCLICCKKPLLLRSNMYKIKKMYI